MKDHKEICWGIIGVGDVCEVKSGPAFQKVPHSRLVAVMRRSGDKAKDYARRHHVPKWYDNADELINDPEVNAVYIATPPDSHEYYALRVAAAGKPVYVEKPMARTYEECLSMVKGCAAAKVPLFVAYYRRALPNFLKVKELVDSGVIGEIRAVDIKLIKPLQPDIIRASEEEGNWRVKPEIAGGGYFYDLASHQLDFLDYLFGPIKQAKGIAANLAGRYPADDIVSASFRLENGVVGQGLWCFNAAIGADEEVTTIYGSQGQISFPYFGDHHVKLQIAGKAEQVFHFEMPEHIQQPLIQLVVDELLGKGTCPSTGFTGARTNWVMGEICGSGLAT